MERSLKLKVTVAKLIELSIESNKNITLKIVRSKGPIKLTVDVSGKATLSAKVGIVTFNGGAVLEELGVAVKLVSVTFRRNSDDTLRYTGSFKIGLATLFISGNFDIEKLILSCSGILCIAARALKNRNGLPRNKELERIMR